MHPQAVDGTDSVVVVANVLNKQLWTANKMFSTLETEWEQTPQYVMKCYAGPQIEMNLQAP